MQLLQHSLILVQVIRILITPNNIQDKQDIKILFGEHNRIRGYSHTLRP